MALQRMLPNIQRRFGTYSFQTLPNIRRIDNTNVFYEANITLIQKLGKDNTKEKNSRSISVMNSVAKNLKQNT